MSSSAFRLLSAILVGILLATSLPIFVPKAQACSCDSREEGWVRAEYVFVGRVSGWNVISDPPPVSPFYLTIELTVEVERVLKGAPPASLTFVDRATFTYRPDPADPAEQIDLWAGSGGACGTFNADPTGARALYSLSSLPDGELEAGMCSGTYLGPPQGVPGGVTTLLDDVIALAEAALGVDKLPDTGAGPSPSGGPALPVLALAVSGAALAAAGGLLVVRRR
jgi:hypothetical protein